MENYSIFSIERNNNHINNNNYSNIYYYNNIKNNRPLQVIKEASFEDSQKIQINENNMNSQNYIKDHQI